MFFVFMPSRLSAVSHATNNAHGSVCGSRWKMLVFHTKVSPLHLATWWHFVVDVDNALAVLGPIVF